MPNHLRSIVAAALGVLAWIALAPPARAEEAEGWRSTALLLGRMNPVGLAADLELAYGRRLYDAAHPLCARNGARVAAGVEVTPTSVSPRLGVELRPLSVLTLGVEYEPKRYTGALGGAQSYPSARARLGGGAFGPVAEGPGGGYALTVHRLVLRGALQAKAGRVAARAAVEATRIEARLHGDDRVLYDPGRDILVYRRGWVAQGDLDVVWMAGDDLTLGVRTTAVTAWYPQDAFADGRPGLRERTTLRAGPLARWTVFRGRGGLLDEGSVIAAAQWWLAHPDRAGRTSPQAVPLALAVVQVSGAP
jgi:hypothetical protein